MDLCLEERAQQFAVIAHGEQLYGTLPFAYHLQAVVNNVRVYMHPHTEVHRAVAWLHDVLEDTKVDGELLGLKFGPRVAELVWRLTDVRDGVNRKERQARTHAKTSEDSEAVGIKLCDRLANTRHSYGHMVESKTDYGLFKMYVKEYPAFRAVMWRPDEWRGLWHELDDLLLERGEVL